MANYAAKARTNRFKVKDSKAFEKALPLDVEVELNLSSIADLARAKFGPDVTITEPNY